MILRWLMNGKIKALPMIGRWKEVGRDQSTLVLHKNGTFKVISKEGVELKGEYITLVPSDFATSYLDASNHSPNISFYPELPKDSKKGFLGTINLITEIEGYSYRFENGNNRLILEDEAGKGAKQVYERINQEDGENENG